MIFCASAPLLQAVEQEQAIARAVDCLRALNPQLAPGETARVGAERKGRPNAGPYWFVTTARYFVLVEDATGDVSSVQDTEALGRVGRATASTAERAKPFFPDPARAIAHAKRVAESVGWVCGPTVRHRPLPTTDAAGDVRLATLYFTFIERPNGYPTNGDGNIVQVGLNSLTGDLVEMERRVGFTYEPAVVNLTAEQAKQRAAAAITLGPAPTVTGPLYEPAERSHPSSRALALIQEKKIPLVYFVRGPEQAALVATDTGEVLCHFGIGTGARIGSPERAPETASQEVDSGLDPNVGSINAAVHQRVVQEQRSIWLAALVWAVVVCVAAFFGCWIFLRCLRKRTSRLT
jgi:hypothetical protein